MNVAELAEQIATTLNMDKKEARAVVDGVFKAVVEAAQQGDEVSIPSFGKFKVASREARQGRNPATGETIQIAASKKLNFMPAKQVKDAMNPPGAAPAAKAASAPKAASKAAPAAKATPAKAAPKPRAKK